MQSNTETDVLREMVLAEGRDRRESAAIVAPLTLGHFVKNILVMLDVI